MSRNDMFLESQYDPDYEPSKEEMKEYAEWLGMHPVDDEQLMWIAREGLRAPLPEDWRRCKTKRSDGQDGNHYYFNFRTGESIWDHPLDAKFKELYKDQSQKKKDGKPFKRCVDNEVLEGLGIAKIIKAHEAKKKKGKKLTQTDTLERQNSGGALTSTEAENKKGKSTDGTAGSTTTAAVILTSCELEELKRDCERIDTEEGEEVEDGAVSEDANSSVPSDFVFVPKAVQGAVEEEGVEVQVEEIGRPAKRWDKATPPIIVSDPQNPPMFFIHQRFVGRLFLLFFLLLAVGCLYSIRI